MEGRIKQAKTREKEDGKKH